MFKTQQRLVSIVINIFSLLLFLTAIYFLTAGNTVPSFFWIIVVAITFGLMLLLINILSEMAAKRLEAKALYTKETALLSDFIAKLRFAFSIDDLIELIKTDLEDKAGCSVLFVERDKNYVIYNSPTRIVSNSQMMELLARNFPLGMADGVYYLDSEYGMVSKLQKACGFFVVYGTTHFFVFCRYTRLFNQIVFGRFYEEFVSFEKRNITISKLTEIAELAKEWSLVAETQKSFLPAKMPEVKNLDIAAYFRPLVNVSGDYYSVIPIDEFKTLVMLGDVSGKGLAAALVMGVVINTIKNYKDKEDLVAMVYAVDRAIKGMRLQDKYTVLFIGIIDTEKMNITYINASMSDPVIVTNAPSGYKIKSLSSNCSLIGIIELEDIHVEQQQLFREDMILIASDGVSEVMDDEGVELGNTELYINAIQNSAYKSARHFVADIADLVLSYTGDKKLRDDVTMLAIKVERGPR